MEMEKASPTADGRCKPCSTRKASTWFGFSRMVNRFILSLFRLSHLPTTLWQRSLLIPGKSQPNNGGKWQSDVSGSWTGIITVLRSCDFAVQRNRKCQMQRVNGGSSPTERKSWSMFDQDRLVPVWRSLNNNRKIVKLEFKKLPNLISIRHL